MILKSMKNFNNKLLNHLNINYNKFSDEYFCEESLRYHPLFLTNPRITLKDIEYLTKI